MNIIIRQDNNKKGRLGVGLTPPADKRADKAIVSEEMVKLGINEETKFTLYPNKTYDLSDPYIAYWINVAKSTKVIGDKKQMGSAYYYIENVEEDAKEEVSIQEEMLEVLLQIKELSHEDKINMAKMLGVDGSTMSLTVLTKYLYDIAQTPVNKNRVNFRTIANILKDRDYDWKLLIAELKFKDLIRYENNQWIYGQTFLGYDELGVLDFIKNPNNQAVCNQFKHLIYKNKEVKEVQDIKETKTKK